MSSEALKYDTGFVALSPRAIGLRAILLVALTLFAGLALFPNGQLALAVDSSPAALGGEQTNDSTDHIVIAGLSNAPLTPDAIRELARVERQLREQSELSSIHSAVSVKTPATLGLDIVMATLIGRLQAANGEPAGEREAILQATQEPLLRGRYISTDGRSVAIHGELHGSHAQRQQAARSIDDLLEALPHGTLRWEMTGAPLISGLIGDLIMRQMTIVLPASLLIFTTVILLAFRSLLVLLGTLISILAALLWTLGVCAALSWSLNLVTVILPPLVLTLAVSYAMHVVSAHADQQSLEKGLHSIRLPLILSALTTAVGLSALGLNSLFSVQQFAALGSIGTVMAALSAWTILPLFLAFKKAPPKLWPPLNSALLWVATRIVHVAIEHSSSILRLGLLVALICALGATLIQPGARYVRDLPMEQPVRQAYEDISRAFGGATRFEIDIEGASAGIMLAPDVMAAIDDLEHWLLQQAEVGSAISPIDFIKRLRQAFGSGTPADYALPDNADMARQLIYFAAPDEIYQYTNRAFSKMRIAVVTSETDTPQLMALFARINQRVEQLPPGLEAHISGDAVELTEVIRKLTDGQLKSLGIAGLAIYILLSLLFASPRVGAMAMLPNAVPVLAFFALLGFTGTPLSPTTALVACIVLGIAVDDTLHLLVRFNQLAKDLANEAEASRAAVKEVMRPITLTTIAVCLGFLTLVGSPFHSQVMFGVLAAATLIIAWISDLLLAPAVSARSSIVTLWDHMRLDLGGAPHHTIPLMAEMSERQARLLALNGSIRTLASGTELIHQGDSGTDMYVVLDGCFDVEYQDSSGKTHLLTTLQRGATLGEIGHFSAVRAATVRAMEASRVLVLNDEILERLRRRHTSVAALVYRNLNRIQAHSRLDQQQDQTA